MISIRSNVISGVALSEVDGEIKILLMKRTKEGFWCHISGNIEEGETAWQAVIRELFEETQIVVKKLYNGEYIEQFYEPSRNRIELVPSFVVFCPPDQAVVLNSEHTEFRWCSLEEAKSLVPFPNQKALYDHVWKHFVLERPSMYMEIDIAK